MPRPFRTMSPRLRFIVDPTTGIDDGVPAPVTPAAPATATVPEPAPAFPANTAPADMTPEQQAAYWQHRSRQNENAKNAAERRVADAEAKNFTADQQREAELRAEGASQAAEPFIRTAVSAEIRLATGKTPEQVASLLAYVDVSKFVKDGVLDADKIASYATSIGTAPVAPVVPAVLTPAQAVANLTRTNADGSAAGMSISDRRKALVESQLGRKPVA